MQEIMPLSRFRSKSVYSLADPELYRTADRDDPQAILEGVAMAGLVGVLRQLGDLAEFAAEVFRDLHEEVMTIAARGHGLTLRIRQLEAEFPSIEKASLSQTDHSRFFHNTGVDWHPNMDIEQHLVTRNGLPRFIMEYCKDCRRPPELTLLDKFDVAGSGACLKRYTDPSIFKTEMPHVSISKSENLKDKKARRAKKASHSKNGVITTDVLSTSHTKLHQLFLEERAQNGQRDTGRRVKLKKRQLDEHMHDLQTRKSYMERFLEDPYQEHKPVRDISMLPLSKAASDESGHSPSPLPSIEESELPIHRFSLIRDDEIAEKELTVVGESRITANHSDDVASEIDDYMDALTSEPDMESAMPIVKGSSVFLYPQKTDEGNSSYGKGSCSHSMSSSGSHSFIDDLALDGVTQTETSRTESTVCVDLERPTSNLDRRLDNSSGQPESDISECSNVLENVIYSNGEDYMEAMPPLPPLPPAEWTGRLRTSLPTFPAEEIIECHDVGPNIVLSSVDVPGDDHEADFLSSVDLPTVVDNTDAHEADVDPLFDVPGISIEDMIPCFESLTVLEKSRDPLTSQGEKLLSNQPEERVPESRSSKSDDSRTSKDENLLPHNPEECVSGESDLNRSVTEVEEQTRGTSSTSGSSPMPSIFGDKPSGLPKTRHPLMEAVAARDKSKLRKVVERVRPSLAANAGERNSIFEQIRSGSFKLKPAPPVRPSIQGPKTNLTVVAIVEKASAMRQAIAGSDEDDDSDRWSDDS